MKVYLANGLFSMGDRMLNEHIAQLVRNEFSDIQLYLPQENMAINDKSLFADSQMIAKGDDAHLLESDFMIAVIDGVEIDSGVACEIGVFSTTNKPIFALCTDMRQFGRDNPKKVRALQKDGMENQFLYRNLYVVGKIKLSGGSICATVEDLISEMKKHIEKEQA